MEPLPLPIEGKHERDGDLNAGNISEIIASSPKTDDEASILLWEPVTHDCDEAWKEECVEDSDENLDKIIVRLVSPIKETWQS